MDEFCSPTTLCERMRSLCRRGSVYMCWEPTNTTCSSSIAQPTMPLQQQKAWFPYMWWALKRVTLHLGKWYCIQTLTRHSLHVNYLHRLLNCEIGGLDCHVITTEHVSIVYTCNTYFIMHWSM